MLYRTIALAAFTVIWSGASSAFAQIPMQGSFVAEARCPALQSIRQKSNPGTVATEPGARYDIIGRNTDPATHYYLTIPGAEPERRWVAVGCGRVATAEDQIAQVDDQSSASTSLPETTSAARKNDTRGTAALAEALTRAGGRSGGGRSPASEPATASPQSSPSGRYVLAASWHAAFCETSHRSRECRNGGVDDRFVLHGLWPDDAEYCGNAAGLRGRSWSELPEPDLSEATRDILDAVMPGTAGNLHRHEWARHGSCYGGDAEEYFLESALLIEQLNASAALAVFARNVGREIDANDIRGGFDKAFGHGAGTRVTVECDVDEGRRIIGELRIRLSGAITPQSDLGGLIRNASTAPMGCPAGIVDRRGDQ